MAGKVHSKPIDAPEVVGACMTPVVMFVVRIAMAAAHRVEDAVVAEEEGEEP